MKNKFDFFNNLDDALCVFDDSRKIVYKNSAFKSFFSDIVTFDKLKKRFDFDGCLLSSENLSEKTPLDMVLASSENVHVSCKYRHFNGEYLFFSVSSFNFDKYKTVVFKNVSAGNEYDLLNKRYNELNEKYHAVNEENKKNAELKEEAALLALKMGIINKISLVIRETNDLTAVISRAAEEIHKLSGGFKTYFSLKDKGKFKIVFSVNETLPEIPVYTEYEPEIMRLIKDKQVISGFCRKEYINSEEVSKTGFKRIIIPVYDKNKLLGIMVTLTKQKFSAEDNKEVLQAVSGQLSGALITSGLISQLNKKNKKLEKALTELKNTQIQLINTEKMASLGRLASGIAHEINTPLASINSNAGMISKILKVLSCRDEEKVKLIRDLNDIDIEAVKRISDIVKSLRKFVRLDEAEFQPADINDELDIILKIISHETKNSINIVKKYGKLPPVMCSVNMLNQVFMNLLVNSCRSIKEKSGTGEIVITTSVSDGMLVVSIKDDGVGIPQNIAGKIFNAGFTTRERGLGTGFGLAISKNIIELHNGSISFVSSEGNGCEFFVKIPLNL